MKPFDGGGWRGVSRVNDRGDLHRAYDESGEMLMHLQATVDYEHFARALSIGPETMVMDFRPDQPMHKRYAVTHGFLSESAGNQTVADQPDRERLLPLGVQLLRDARGRRRGLPDRLRQRLPGRRRHLAALLLPVGDHRAGALVGLLRGHRPPRRRRPADQPLLRDRRRPALSTTTRSSTATSPSPTSTSRPSATGTGASNTSPTSTSRCRVGHLRRLRPAAPRHRRRRRTRRTSRRSSSPTSAACSACGPPSSFPPGVPRTGRSSARARPRRPAPCSAAPGTRPRRHRCRRPGGWLEDRPSRASKTQSPSYLVRHSSVSACSSASSSTRAPRPRPRCPSRCPSRQRPAVPRDDHVRVVLEVAHLLLGVAGAVEAPSRQTPQRGTACGRPSRRTVTIQ